MHLVVESRHTFSLPYLLCSVAEFLRAARKVYFHFRLHMWYQAKFQVRRPSSTMWEELSRAGATERASGAGEQTSISLTDGDLHSFLSLPSFLLPT